MYVGGNARYLFEADSDHEIIEALRFAKEKRLPVFILGGGSNILVSDMGFPGLVIRIAIKGRMLIGETESYVDYEVGAGESWDSFVQFAVDLGLYGIENLSHIPGTVGASVVQNIGAYGQEVSESVLYVKTVDVETLEEVVFQKSEMQFTYRKSRLNDKTADKGRYVVTRVAFRLMKVGELNMKYNDIRKYFEAHIGTEPNLQSIRTAVISIRDRKFPFPDSPENGTVGSFWNAESISEANYENIIKKLEEKGFNEKADEMRYRKNVFSVAQGFKVPYGVLVEVLGYKGMIRGNVRILDTHSCVINNFTGNASSEEVFSLSEEVVEAVHREFGIKMKVEPEFVGYFTANKIEFEGRKIV